MTTDEIKQAADELMHAALCGSKTGRADYIHVVENDKLYRWHKAMQALLQQPRQDDRNSEPASLTDRLNTALRECNSPLQAELRGDLRPFIQALVDAARRQGAFWHRGEQPQQDRLRLLEDVFQGAAGVVEMVRAGVKPRETMEQLTEAVDAAMPSAPIVAPDELDDDDCRHWLAPQMAVMETQDDDQQSQRVVPPGHVVVPVPYPEVTAGIRRWLTTRASRLMARVRRAEESARATGNPQYLLAALPQRREAELCQALAEALERRPTP